MSRLWTLVAAFVVMLLPVVAGAQDVGPAPTAMTTININTATQQQFEQLPGIGTKTAIRIIEFRQKNGPFRKVEEMMNVKGIGEKSFLKLKPYLSVGAPKADKAVGAQP
jgi:competence protein ComEA